MTERTALNMIREIAAAAAGPHRFNVVWSGDAELDDATRAAAEGVMHDLLDEKYDRYMTMLHRLFVRSLVRPTRLLVLCDHVSAPSRPS